MDENHEVKTIFHSGVLGMKWGRRRGPGTDTASDGVRLKGPNGKALIVSKETRNAKGNLEVQYGGKKTSAVGELVGKKAAAIKNFVATKTPLGIANNKIKEYANKLEAKNVAKAAHNDKVSALLNKSGDKYDKTMDEGESLMTRGADKAKYGFSSSERAIGKAQVRAGEQLIKEADKTMESEYKDIPPYQVTTGIAIARTILAAGAIAGAAYMYTHP